MQYIQKYMTLYKQHKQRNPKIAARYLLKVQALKKELGIK